MRRVTTALRIGRDVEFDLLRERGVGHRHGDAESARLEIRLFQRPVVEERPRLLRHRQGAQRRGLPRRKEAAGDVVREPAPDVLDVDAARQAVLGAPGPSPRSGR